MTINQFFELLPAFFKKAVTKSTLLKQEKKPSTRRRIGTMIWRWSIFGFQIWTVLIFLRNLRNSFSTR